MDRRPLDVQRLDFAGRPLIAMPIAGALAWSAVALGGAFLSAREAALVLFAATGLIFYIAVPISRLTGERFLDRSRPMNAFDALFLHFIGMSLLCYAIAIPFFLIDRTSLPLTVGILTGLMWVPFSWVIQHWIGIAHAILRTIVILAAWYVWPLDRYVTIPVIIVALYVLVIAVLVRRRDR